MKQFLIKIHLLVFSLLIAFPLFAQEVSTTTQVFTGPDFGTTILVPIYSTDITATYGNLVTATIRVEYNEAVLTYVGFTNLNPALSSLTITVFPNGAGGVVQLNMEDLSGFPWPDGKAFDLQFTFNGGNTDVNITNAEFLSNDFENTYNSPVVNGNVSGYTNLTASNGDWHQASTWTGYLGGLTAPGLGHNVTILSGGTVTIGADAVCNSLTIANGGRLTLDAGKTLTDNGNFTIESGGSFIQNGTLAVAGTTTVERYIAANEWHLISAPISDAQSGMFDGKFLQTHSESTNEYTDVESLTEPLVPMKGYAVWNASGFTANYVGTLNNGAQSYTTSYSGVGKGWNLVGNPYPSSIDWQAAGWTKTNVSNATYVHVDASKWASFVDNVGENGGSQYIAPGQGFFVQATANGTLSMDNSVRTHTAAPFFKSTVSNLVRLQVSGNGYADEAVIRILPEATSEFDGNYDAVKLYGDVAEAAQIYTLGSSPLAINALPETNSVPVGIHAGASGTYTIAATEVNDIQAITLKDNQTGISTNLLVNSFSFSFTPGENEQRFTLYFSPLSVNEVENSLASIYSNQNTLYVDLKSLSKGDIYVYNLAGQLVTSASANQGMNMIRLTNTGNYIVKVITPKTTLVKKVFIQ